MIGFSIFMILFVASAFIIVKEYINAPQIEEEDW
jgi:hypothetical protein